MSQKAKKENHDSTEQLRVEFEQLTDGQGLALDGLRNMQVAGQTLLQREEIRLAQKLGADHPRLQRLRARRLELVESTHRLATEVETARIRVPDVSETEVLVHGRILDEHQRGLSGLTVYAVDAAGQPVTQVEQVTTDAKGYYALKVDPAKVPAKVREQLVLAVRTPTERVVHQTKTPLKLAPGSRQLTEVQLERGRPGVIRPKPGRDDTDDDRPSPGEAWIVSGAITDEAGQPLPGLMVSLFDKDRRYDDKLGAALTNDKGRFKITYLKQDFKEGPEPGADLYLTVIDKAGKQLYSSKKSIRYNAGREEVFDIRIASSKLKPKARTKRSK